MDNMQLCYGKTLLTTSVCNLLTPELISGLAQDLEKPKKNPTGVTIAEHPVAPLRQAGVIGDKQPCL